MSEPLQPESRRQRGPFLIENAYEKESSESFVEQHFRKGPLHRAKDSGEYDLNAIVREYGDSLIRSSQELAPNPVGKGHLPHWISLVFQRPNNVFWHFVSKSNSYGQNETERIFNLTITSAHAGVASEEIIALRKQFLPDDMAPAFFFVKDVRNPRRMPLKLEYMLNDSDMALHYGDDFVEWAGNFSRGLHTNGLSILRGKPGTGKTSFLRHLICQLAQTHRFYYLPVDAFGLLHGGLMDFLSKEKQRHREATLVVVLEDAEQLLLDRRGMRDGLASTLLNFTDGFVGDLVTAHLICTVNSEAKELDEAVLRPGRQRFFHEFELVPWKRARLLSTKLGVSLEEQRSYSLAELYHFRDMQCAMRLTAEPSRQIGFRHS